MAIDTSKPLLDAFQKEYPFIKAELVRAGEEQLMNRVLSETRAGRWLFDAISTSRHVGGSSDRHMITPYLTPERDAFLSEFKDPQGYWTGIFVNNLVLCYNTKMLGGQRCAEKLFGPARPEVEGQDVDGLHGLRLVRHVGDGLGQRKNRSVHETSGGCRTRYGGAVTA